MNIKLVCKTLALPVMTLFGSSAMAQTDSKTLPGSMCQPASNTAVFSKDSSGRISNPSTTAPLIVNCPVVRDVSAANGTNGVSVGWIRVVDNHPVQNINCTLVSENKLNNNFTDSITDVTAGVGVQQLDYLDLASSFEGYYHYHCTIPPRSNGASAASAIKAYFVREVDINP